MYFLQFQMVLHSKDSILIFLTGIRLIIHFIFQVYRIYLKVKRIKSEFMHSIKSYAFIYIKNYLY